MSTQFFSMIWWEKRSKYEFKKEAYIASLITLLLLNIPIPEVLSHENYPVLSTSLS